MFVGRAITRESPPFIVIVTCFVVMHETHKLELSIEQGKKVRTTCNDLCRTSGSNDRLLYQPLALMTACTLHLLCKKILVSILRNVIIFNVCL